MKIRSMTATFGKLENARLEPGPGLSLIHAPNEGGKSTWAAFWRAMLYGIDTRDRDKKGYLADKNRYQPWSGAPMEGEITLEWQGRDITIRRGPRGSTPFGAFSAVYTGTEEPVPGMTAANCGELLTGASRPVFERSAFLGGENLSLTSSPELERRIAALVSSGEEDVSFSQAMARLKDWKNKRQVNRSVGEIPRLEEELAQVRDDLSALEEVTGQIARLEEELAQLEAGRRDLEQDRDLHQALARRDLNRRYTQAQQELEAARRQLATLEEEGGRLGALPSQELLKRAQGELQYVKLLDEEIKQGSAALREAEEKAGQARAAARDDLFSELTGEEAVSKAAADQAAYQAYQERGKKLRKWSWLLPLLGLLVLAPLLFWGVTRRQPLCLWLGGGIFALLALLSLPLLFRFKAAQKQAAEILSQYGVQAPEELAVLAQSYRDRCRQAEEAARQAEVIRAAVTQRRDNRASTWEELLAFVHTFAPQVQNEFSLSAALSRALSLDHELASARDRLEERRRRLDDLAAQGGKPEDIPESLPAPARPLHQTTRALASVQQQLEQARAQLNQAQGRQRAMGDPAALAARQEELEAALARRRLEFDALDLAMEALTQSNARLQERFSPALNRLAGRYLARLTGDKYTSVTLTRELEGAAQRAGDVLPRSALYLSRGTVDQLYLAVRLAVCRMCLPDHPPIFLDDALSTFDDSRLALALELLGELAGEQQILLFTCQRREGQALPDAPDTARLSL